MSTGIERLRLRISGRVQGVWFRGSMEHEAQRLGVAGWVRNLPDGKVEALVEGEPAKVRELVRWAHVGSSGAHVTAVIETPEPALGDLRGFQVRH